MTPSTALLVVEADHQNYFTSSDPHHGILFGVYSGVLSGAYSGTLPGMLDGILFDIYSGILSGIFSHTLPLLAYT